MKRATHTLAIALLFLLSASTGYAAQILFSQPASCAAGDMFASQNDTALYGYGKIFTVFDNFEVATSSRVTAVKWNGGFWNGNPGAISSFTITFWSDDSGKPGTIVRSQISCGNCNEALIDGSLYTYYATLRAPIFLTATTQYWLSLVPDLDMHPQWGWHGSACGDGIAYQDILGSPNQLGSDLAFDLYGESSLVPEPATCILLGAGLGALALITKRKKSRQ